MEASFSAQIQAQKPSQEAMPEMQQKGDSVYSIQQEETHEKARLKEQAEIQEIEAMFAALEIAELAEQEEEHPDAVDTHRATQKRVKMSLLSPEAILWAGSLSRKRGGGHQVVCLLEASRAAGGLF